MCIIWYGSNVDHLLMPGCPEVENSYQDPFPSLSVFQYSVLIINGCGLEMGVVLLEKKRTPLFQALDPPLSRRWTSCSKWQVIQYIMKLFMQSKTYAVAIRPVPDANYSSSKISGEIKKREQNLGSNLHGSSSLQAHPPTDYTNTASPPNTPTFCLLYITKKCYTI